MLNPNAVNDIITPDSDLTSLLPLPLSNETLEIIKKVASPILLTRGNIHIKNNKNFTLPDGLFRILKISLSMIISIINNEMISKIR